MRYLSNPRSGSLALLCLTLFFTGCSSTEQTAGQQVNFDHELYDGKPTLGLTNEFPPETPEEAIVRGDKAYMGNNPDLALYEYIRALSFPSQKDADQAYYKIGYIHQQRNNFELSKLAYGRAALIKADNIQYAAALGVVQLKLGEHKNAEAQLLRVARMDQDRQNNKDWLPNSQGPAKQLALDKQSPLNAYIGLGILADLDARHKDAQAIYLAILKLEQKSPKALMNLGYSYYLDGNLPQAEIINQRTTLLYPNNKRAWSNLGLTYIKAKRYDDALDALSKIMTRAEALNDIGYFSMLSGDYESAVYHLEQAINASPTYYAKAYQNLDRAKKLQLNAPAVKLSNKMNDPINNSQIQATVYSITDTTH
ncbi:tetratricopeptide repeat protein [Photobacterium sp. MCCC 1A19761]|uniref:tetratricopeptide repeat protein n=1 Tax=Photobacterium sp. MCCC 1A19761 TaxID=3115000 RepID=UPI00307F1F33